MNKLLMTLAQYKNMKLNLKNSVAGMLVAFSFLPMFAFAETGSTKVAKVKENFCTNISIKESKTLEIIKRAEERQAKNEAERSDKIAKKESDVDAKRAQNRSDIDAKRLKNWDRMVSKAKTDTQKTAVEAYKTAISSAVTVRRTSVDAAVKTYRDALTGTITTHSSAIDQVIAAFKASVDTSLVKAKADCAASVDPKTVKDTYNKSVSEARKVLQTARKAANDNSGITTLKKTREESIKLAETTFKQATEKARADLLLALK
jgi:hypothetical protein